MTLRARQGALLAKTTHSPSDRTPVTIRLSSEQRLRLKRVANELGTTVSKVITLVLDYVADEAVNPIRFKLNQIADRMEFVFETHGLSRLEAADILSGYGFTPRTFENKERLLDAITTPAIELIASMFHVEADWLHGTSNQVFQWDPFWTPEKIGTQLFSLPNGRSKLLLVKETGEEFDVLRETPRRTLFIQSVTKQTPHKKNFQTYRLLCCIPQNEPNGQSIIHSIQEDAESVGMVVEKIPCPTGLVNLLESGAILPMFAIQQATKHAKRIRT